MRYPTPDHIKELEEHKQNQEYIEQRDALIPDADVLAKKMFEKHIEDGGNQVESRDGYQDSRHKHDYYTEFFFKAMNELAYKEGLQPWR